MTNSGKQESAEDRRIDDVDRADQVSEGDASIEVSSSGGEMSNRSVTRRLTEILVDDRDADLLLKRSGREDGVIQWLRALDFHVMGACRADERLKPLLKMNASGGVADDGLLAHLSQHFEPSEVGMLARCLCAPLVSIRVGKINKQGTRLSPTSVRGNLCLALLPTSHLRISFNGDDGSQERLATLSTEAQCTEIEIEEIPADKSGRSFLIKNLNGLVSYFWCSEKSVLLGYESLRKLKDLLARKPSLAELTGISESRLNSFLSHLRAHLAGSVVNNADGPDDSSELDLPHSPVNCPKSSRTRQHGNQETKSNLLFHGCLSPRSNSFKEGTQKSSSDIRIATREKLRRRGEHYAPGPDISPWASSKRTDASTNKLPEVNGILQFATPSFLDVFGSSEQQPVPHPDIQVPPHYCWCPPVVSVPLLPISSIESLSLPPLSSLLSSARPSGLLTSNPLLDLADTPPVNFPSLPSSQHIPTFTPLICDPIVHIPVINICSLGQGYLVSAGPAMPTSIPPLKPKLVDGESMVDKSARETLRMLISSSNEAKPQLLEVLPSVLSSSIDNHNIVAAGTIEVGGFPSSMPSFELVLSENSTMSDRNEKVCGTDPSNFEEKGKE